MYSFVLIYINCDYKKNNLKVPFIGQQPHNAPEFNLNLKTTLQIQLH